jgi:formylglycine-generating enzyme required for sulfatase activity
MRSAVASEPKRVALIIANSDYTSGLSTPILNPCPESDSYHLCNVAGDALLIREALIDAGFRYEDIDVRRNLRKDDIRAALDTFKQRSRDAQISLVYLAGHGVLVKKDNWFIPVGSHKPIDIRSDYSDIPTEAFNLQTFVSVTAGARWRIVIMDACRDDPFANAERRAVSGREEKIAADDQHDKLDANTLLIYSTAQGKPALDGEDDANSNFARAFARRVAQSNLPLRKLGHLIAGDMAKMARPGAKPQIASIVDTLPAASFFLVAADKTAAGVTRTNQDEDDWISTLNAAYSTNDSAPLRAYLKSHGAGVHPARARSLIAELEGTPGGAAARPAPTAGSSFTDCETGCPEMVVVPSGSFWMKPPEAPADASAEEKAAAAKSARVTFAQPFAVSAYPITFEEWDACVQDRACQDEKVKDPGSGRRKLPVINTSWDDAQSYIDWLSRRTGERYRLLSEAEYDYANRAGSTSTFWWGDGVGSGHANCKGCDAVEKTQILPVGSFPPNKFGLFDTEGNVPSWTEDCWSDPLQPRTDGKADVSGDCNQRVLRGGSYRATPKSLESSYRGKYIAKERLDITGFRVARDF